MSFSCKTFYLNTPAIMAVLNITPDSFSDGGKLFKQGRADWDSLFSSAETMLAQGATILDVGGESTRPGAAPVTQDEELARVIPVVEALSQRFDCILSVDTSTPQVMKEAVNAGAHMLNDVRALTRPGALETAAALDVPVCLMHMQGQPGTMQNSPQYDHIVDEVKQYLLSRVEAFVQKGGQRDHILLDPGFGFGKTFEHNQTLFKHISALAELPYPLLVGVSRKSMLGHIIDRPESDRVTASAVAAALAINNGAAIVRVHDVAETADAIKTINALGN